jgi:hypothetical protein
MSPADNRSNTPGSAKTMKPSSKAPATARLIASSHHLELARFSRRASAGGRNSGGYHRPSEANHQPGPGWVEFLSHAQTLGA